MAKRKEELEKEPTALVAEESVEKEVITPSAESEDKSTTEEHTEEKVNKEEHEVEKEVEEQPVESTVPNESEPVTGDQSTDSPRIFPPYAYDISTTKEDTQQEKLLMQQGLHYLAQKIKMQKEAREEKEMIDGIPEMEIMYYGTYSIDWTDVRYREIGKTIPEIAYLNYWAPQRCIMLNVEWLPRLVEDGYILMDLTPGTWEGYINKKNVAKYMRKVDYLLKKGKIRP